MTIIAAMVTEDWAVMASDSNVLDGWVLHSSVPKCTEKNGWLMGSSGMVRVRNALQYEFTPPTPPENMDHAWVSTTFISALRSTLNERGIAVIDGYIGGKDDAQQTSLLFARPGWLFTVMADWAVDFWPLVRIEQNRPNLAYAAIGSGHRQSLGSMFASVSCKGIPVEVTQGICHVRDAVQAAICFDVYCGGEVGSVCFKRQGEFLGKENSE